MVPNRHGMPLVGLVIDPYNPASAGGRQGLGSRALGIGLNRFGLNGFNRLTGQGPNLQDCLIGIGRCHMRQGFVDGTKKRTDKRGQNRGTPGI